MTLSLSELTPIVFYMELTHLASKASILKIIHQICNWMSNHKDDACWSEHNFLLKESIHRRPIMLIQMIVCREDRHNCYLNCIYVMPFCPADLHKFYCHILFQVIHFYYLIWESIFYINWMPSRKSGLTPKPIELTVLTTPQ